VEQNFHFASALADRVYVIERGRIVLGIGKGQLQEKQAALQELLAV
jgi:ABC-type branched-subunit amino acid transport system ATPase component